MSSLGLTLAAMTPSLAATSPTLDQHAEHYQTGGSEGGLKSGSGFSSGLRPIPIVHRLLIKGRLGASRWT